MMLTVWPSIDAPAIVIDWRHEAPRCTVHVEAPLLWTSVAMITAFQQVYYGEWM